jgi:hypothetical protein
MKDVIESDCVGPAQHSIFGPDLHDVAAEFLYVVDKSNFIGCKFSLPKDLNPICLTEGHEFWRSRFRK